MLCWQPALIAGGYILLRFLKNTDALTITVWSNVTLAVFSAGLMLVTG